MVRQTGGACRAGVLARKNRTQNVIVNDIDNVVPLFGRIALQLDNNHAPVAAHAAPAAPLALAA